MFKMFNKEMHKERLFGSLTLDEKTIQKFPLEVVKYRREAILLRAPSGRLYLLQEGHRSLDDQSIKTKTLWLSVDEVNIKGKLLRNVARDILTDEVAAAISAYEIGRIRYLYNALYHWKRFEELRLRWQNYLIRRKWR